MDENEELHLFALKLRSHTSDLKAALHFTDGEMIECLVDELHGLAGDMVITTSRKQVAVDG